VDIDKLTANDILPIDISGGYILRRDKLTNMDENEYWRSPVAQPFHERMTYQYFDPKFKDLTSDQASYIKNWMENFDRMMSGNDFNDPNTGYKKYIKVNSFIDMMFINEISKGVDCYLFSTYFYKENDTDGGELVAGPPWDYNIAYGNLDYGHGHNIPETYRWLYDQGSRVYWWERLMEDETYQNRVYCRWREFRATIFSDENVENIIDSCIVVLGDAIDRNFAKFPTLGTWCSVTKVVAKNPKTGSRRVSAGTRRLRSHMESMLPVYPAGSYVRRVPASRYFSGRRGQRFIFKTFVTEH
jgi:hypothetical protein